MPGQYCLLPDEQGVLHNELPGGRLIRVIIRRESGRKQKQTAVAVLKISGWDAFCFSSFTKVSKFRKRNNASFVDN